MSYKIKLYILVSAINIIYIITSSFLIYKIENSSDNYFVTFFIISFGVICQKLTSVLSDNTYAKRIWIKIAHFISGVCVSLLLCVLVISLFGLLGYVNIDISVNLLKFNTAYSVSKSLPEIPTNVLLHLLFVSIIVSNLLDLILSYPNSSNNSK